MTACMLEKLGPLVPAQPMKLDASVVPNPEEKAQNSPRKMLVFSPHWKTKEDGVYSHWEDCSS